MGEIEDAKVEGEFPPVPMPPLDQLDALAAGLDRIATEAVTTQEVARRLEELGTGSDVVSAIDSALNYNQQAPTDLLECFGPYSTLGGWQIPPPLSRLPYGCFALWGELADRVTNPLLRARLHDLCFVTGTGLKHVHSANAADAYLELAQRYEGRASSSERGWQIMSLASRSLTRAFTLARAMNQRELVTRARSIAVDLASLAVEDPDAGHGTVLSLLEPVVDERDSPDEIDEILDAAQARFGTDGWAAKDIAGFQARHAKDDEERLEYRRRQVEAHVNMADNAQPIVALGHLQDAEELSHRYGLKDLNERIRVRLQDLRGQDLGLTRIEVRDTISRDEIDPLLDRFLGQETWWAALVVMVSSLGPPTGNVDALRSQVPEFMTLAPIATSIGRTVIGPDGAPRDETPGGDPEAVLRQLQGLQLRRTGAFYIIALRAILERWGEISEADAIERFTQAPHVSESAARKIGDALNRHRRGDFEGATSILVPQIENMARQLHQLAGIPVTRPGGRGSSRENLGLGALLDQIEEWGRSTLTSWVSFLREFLIGHLNYRNDTSHGNIDEVGEYESALVIVAAVFLTLVEQGKTTIRTVSDSDAQRLAEAFPEPPGTPDNRHLARLDQQQRGEVTALAAWDGDEPVGYCVVRWRDEGDEATGHVATLGCPELEDLFVAEAVRNQGIGRALVEGAERYAREYGETALGLEVTASNPYNESARKLFAKLGYVDAGIGEFTACSNYVLPDGTERRDDEPHLCLVKNFV